ncbi:MAG: cell division protein ZapE [Pseudomonadota bacterium]
MTPIEYYQTQAALGVIVPDLEQERVLQYLQRLQENLLKEERRRASLFAFLQKPHIEKGVYLWGGVGIGKTFLMDCFFHTLPFTNKLRMHFHRFMQMVHEKLTAHQGEKDPLSIIAEELARDAIVLCFDELLVSDITDAMLLGRLFKSLFDNGVSLVATSNVAPDDLYKNGLQRSQFLPAIALLKKNNDVIHIPSDIDYRLRHLQQAGVFYTPLDRKSARNMEESFKQLTAGKKISHEPVIINDRPIKVYQRSDDVIWFDFKDICTTPRSQYDYLTIAKLYRTVFISNIPVIKENEKDTICLFIGLVDVLYDARVRLVISAAEPVEQIYNRGYMIMEYNRTNSRLIEMQSQDYFANDPVGNS